jgi:transmembrane sensor
MRIKRDRTKQLQKIAKRVLGGTASKAERKFLDEYYDLFESSKNQPNDLTQQENNEIYQDVKTRLQFTTNTLNTPKTHLFYISRVAAAITVLMVTTIATYYIVKTNRAIAPIKYAVVTNTTIVPGSNKATLTLANGTVIALDDKKSGTLAKQLHVQISKTDKGELVYSSIPVNNGDVTTANQFNTLQTPRGGIYQIKLPDGTRVWLNSSSSLRYPVTFSGTERKVDLEGEAYFEVAHNADMPFKVVSKTQTVEVLGTHFNINAYADEDYSKTTLLEGSVRVTIPTTTKPAILVPGQQSIAKPSGIKVRKADGDNIVSWKNGLFQFDNDEIHSIMKKICRWYDVEVEYEKGIENMRFGGTVSRYANIDQVLNKLELTNTIHFKIDGRRIMVMK